MIRINYADEFPPSEGNKEPAGRTGEDGILKT